MGILKQFARRCLVLALGATVGSVLVACSSTSDAVVTSTSVVGGPAQTSSVSQPADASAAASVTVSGPDTTEPTTQTSAGSDTASSGALVSSSSATTTSPSPTPTIVPPVASITASPKFGSSDVSPITPVTITVSKGIVTDLTMKNVVSGYQVKGKLAADKRSWTSGEILGYGKTYDVSGTAKGTDGKTVPFKGRYTVLKPDSEVRTTISPTDGAVVGVAMPIMVKFGVDPADRGAVEKRISVTTQPQVDGAWAWIQHDGGVWGLDFRPKGYWPEGTKVHVEANMYGVNFGGGAYGKTDVSTDFTIGRNQVVIADVNSHELVVKRDGVVVATYPASYGRGIDENGKPDPNLVTRSGIHVVNEMFAEKKMSNPKYGYVNVLERWAVRISDNGEFIHANPNSVDAQGNTNVTHGCVNLSLASAEAYYKSAIIGDPVEVTGTDIQLGPSDGDIFDYAIDWDVWVGLSGKN